MCSKVQSLRGRGAAPNSVCRPFCVQAHDLTRLHLAHELSADGGQGAALRGQAVALAVELADHQRPEAPGIAHAIDGIARQDGQRIGALGLRHEDADARFPVAGRAGDHLGDDLAVR